MLGALYRLPLALQLREDGLTGGLEGGREGNGKDEEGKDKGGKGKKAKGKEGKVWRRKIRVVAEVEDLQGGKGKGGYG